MTLPGPLQLITESFREWQKDKASRLAAALAYYTAGSIAPMLLLIITIAGMVLGEEAARGRSWRRSKDSWGPRWPAFSSRPLRTRASREPMRSPPSSDSPP